MHTPAPDTHTQIHKIRKDDPSLTIIMSTGNAAPVDPLAVAVDDEDEDFLDDYAMMTGDNNHYTLSEKMVHHCGGAILPVHWAACKAVLAFHAGSGVSKMRTTTKAMKEASCLELYYNTIESLDEEHFDRDARDFFCHSFQKKEEPMPAHSVYRYYQDSRAKVRNQVLPFFPRDFVTMRSGRGFHESCNDVYVKAFRLEMSTTKLRNGTLKYTSSAEVEDMLPPQHWEFTKLPCLYGLMVKIYRRDPQLALDVATVMKDRTNAPVSRAVLRRKSQQRARRHNADTAADDAVDDDTAPSPVLLAAADSSVSEESAVAVMHSHHSLNSAHQEKLLWAKATAAKAHAETTNIAKRMGKMEELEKGMALLEKMKGVNGEAMYATQVCSSIFAAMPNFQSFDTAVDIVDVGSAAAAVDRTPADAEWMATKRRLSSKDDEDEEEQEYTPPSKKNRNGATKTPDDDDDDEEEGCDDEYEGVDDATADGLSRYVLTEADEAKYVTYEEITGETGQVIGVHAVDSRVPTDAADGVIIPFKEVKDKDGNVVDRVYGQYKKK